jgi:hypothetical protein
LESDLEYPWRNKQASKQPLEENRTLFKIFLFLLVIKMAHINLVTSSTHTWMPGGGV